VAGTYLVTAGNIGNSVIEGLLARGKKIHTAVLKKQPNAIWDAAGVEQIEFDYARPETLKRAFDGVEAYFCLSPLIQNLAETGIQAVEVAKQAGVRRIVEASGISYTILQPMAFMQNYLLFAGTIRNYKERGALLCPSGRRKAPYVDTRDIADVAMLALTESGHTSKKYRITGGRFRISMSPSYFRRQRETRCNTSWSRTKLREKRWKPCACQIGWSMASPNSITFWRTAGWLR
jgi:uncharacterized protein YbjT (DUF2867 family)